jgi:hypothetical protein
MDSLRPMYRDWKRAFGFHDAQTDLAAEQRRLIRYANLQLIASGLPPALSEREFDFVEVAQGLLANYRQKSRLLADDLAPIDRRIETFLQSHFADVPSDTPLRLPRPTLDLHQHGLARLLSLPVGGDRFVSGYVQSYRVKNGVLHNPKHDRRTTAGTVHVTEGGLPIAGDKRAAPKVVFARLLQRACQPPRELLRLPFTADQKERAETFVSLMMRPIVCPEVPGYCCEKRMETRFFAPGSLVSNLDFVESIFGNAGDPFVPENDAALDVEHWTGHTGCVILAPHLVELTKQELGLPAWADATEQQRRDGMCWRDKLELYNDGAPFKLTCRTAAGVIVTLIADNYFGYCKKEVKTQISYAANLYGGVEEEHAGGAIAFSSSNLGEEFQAKARNYNQRTFEDVVRDYSDFVLAQPSGYGIDKDFPDLIYIPEDAEAKLDEQQITWRYDGREQSIPLLPGQVYMTPSGFKLRLEKHPAAPSWRLIGTMPEGVFCHKPCTVSGGGKSEISKSLVDYMLYGPVFVADVDRDLAQVEEIFNKDYSTRWVAGSPIHPDYSKQPSRRVLDPRRSLGSVIKLLTPSPDYTDEYNAWLDSIPNHIYALAFIIKRFQRANWEQDWRKHFHVDIVNGLAGHELKFGDRKLVGTYLRVGLQKSQAWRTYKLRQDFIAAAKIQTEDDISASVVVPGRYLSNLYCKDSADSQKFVANCEARLFQRPDDAIHRGLDKQTEADMAREDNFISNFEPLSLDDVKRMLQKVVDFDAFSPPMQRLLQSMEQSGHQYVVCSANPRRIDGQPSKNPRYLQNRPDLMKPLDKHVALRGARLYRAIPADQPVLMPVDAVLAGRRNNPPERQAGIRGLAVYGPIHYQELPELFMDYICSLTGKSPSTTGFGSEGALTKAPFNALLPAADLNAALVGYILTGLHGFTTAAGFIGPDVRVDHDISLLVPEIWCRLSPEDRDPRRLIAEGMLEPVADFEHRGEQIPARRLGYRINERFVRRYFGRLFDNPLKVFDEAMLRPETQDRDAFADGIKYIAEAHRRVALQYIDDGTLRALCPPLQVLVTIMAHGQHEGRDERHADVRAMFTRESLLASDWYRARLVAKQSRDTALWQRHVASLDAFLADGRQAAEVERLKIRQRHTLATTELGRVRDPRYLDELMGTLGAEPV